MTPPDAAAFIRAHLPVLPVPELPEIHLHKAVPASGVGRLAADQPPYCAHYSAGALALARYILHHSDCVPELRALALGALSALVMRPSVNARARDPTAHDTALNYPH